MKKILVLLLILIPFILVGCNKEEYADIEVQIVDYKEEVKIIEGKKETVLYIVVANDKYSGLVEVVRPLWGIDNWLEKTYPKEAIITINTKDLIEVRK